MSPAAMKYGARQPATSATSPDAVRARRIPRRRPLITVPTTRPRSSSAARLAANGTRICAVVDVTPTSATRRQQDAYRRGGAGDGEKPRGAHGEHRHQAPPLKEVAQRQEEHEAGGVAHLGSGDDKAGDIARHTKVTPDGVE